MSSSAEPGWEAGATVKIFGLAKAPQHNGKIGKISKKAAEQEGRFGVELGKGQVLAIRKENLELVPTCKSVPEASALAELGKELGLPAELGKERTLTRDNSLLLEFYGTQDPDTLALYYHMRDKAFDCYNAPEYINQLLRYYSAGMSIVAVCPRKLRDNSCFLVCLQHKETEKNTLCEVGFQCMRSFAGISSTRAPTRIHVNRRLMCSAHRLQPILRCFLRRATLDPRVCSPAVLVKHRCFACGKPNVPICGKCHCACFCSSECETRSSELASAYKKLCKVVRAGAAPTIDEEVVQLLP